MNKGSGLQQGGLAQESNWYKKSWWLLANGLAALGGFGLAIYATLHHWRFKNLGTTDFACNVNATVSCDAAAASSYSELVGIPLGVWASGFYLALLTTLVLLWLGVGRRQQQLLAYFMLTVGGLVVSLVLAAISFAVLQVVCLVCIGIYLVNLLLAGLAFKERALLRSSWSLGGASKALVQIAAVMALGIAGCQALKPTGALHEARMQQNAEQPLAPRVEIPIATSPYMGAGEDYRLGDDNAKVTIVAFSDFECPACKHMSEVLEKIREDFPTGVRIVFRNFPLDQGCNPGMKVPLHTVACKIAALARCAGQQEKFWQFHDLAFRNQAQAHSQAEAWAKQVGLSEDDIKACLASDSIKKKVQDDIALGEKLGVDSTPTLFINNRKFEGSREELENTIRTLLE